MKTIINTLNNNWVDIKNKCRTTVNKQYTNNEPSHKFKEQLLISEHSPIRLLEVNWSWQDIDSFVATHLSRHKWECFISTQRSDRTGIDRHTLPQDSLVNMDGIANAQNLIDTARKRLCYQASPETRKVMIELKENITIFEPELGNSLVPNCIYRMSCPEFKTCGFIEKFIKENKDINMFDIKERYNAYNKKEND